MRTIFIGNAERRDQWLATLRTFDRAEVVAVVGSGERAGGGASAPEFASLRDALARGPADLAIVAGDTTAVAIEAARQGLDVVLEDPSSARAADLAALRDASARNQRAATLVATTNRYARRRRLLRRFLTTGKLGAIGHVSCVDHRNSARPGAEASAQLLRHACGHVLGVQALLATRPLSVMAELTARSPQHSSTAAFVELEEGLHIQYFGSVGAAPDHHELWIEGTGGSLRTDGGSFLWRKRGWPLFVPMRVSLGAPGEDLRQARLAALTAIGARGKDTPGALDALTLAAAAMQSHELGRVVPLGATPR